VVPVAVGRRGDLAGVEHAVAVGVEEDRDALQAGLVRVALPVWTKRGDMVRIDT
jgi:hypothetical protein